MLWKEIETACYNGMSKISTSKLEVSFSPISPRDVKEFFIIIKCDTIVALGCSAFFFPLLLLFPLLLWPVFRLLFPQGMMKSAFHDNSIPDRWIPLQQRIRG